MRIELLDHGYLDFIESWGSDERIVEAARMSTGKGFQGWGPVHSKSCNSITNSCDCDGDDCVKCAHLPSLSNYGEIIACNCTPTTGDEKLLAYLWNNKHATPFEMAGMVIEVQAPIMVFREWHRHRTQCLAGDTAINLLTPRGTTFKRTIRELFELKYGGVIDSAPAKHRNGFSKAGTPVTRGARRKSPWRVRILPNCQSRTLRTFDEESGAYRIGAMRDVWESGAKEIWAVATDCGVVRASAQHPFLTRLGWAKVSDIRAGEMIASSGRVATEERPIPPSLRQGIGVWTTMMRSRLIRPVDTCHICKSPFPFGDLELDHVIPVYLDLTRALDVTNLKPACVPCHGRKIATEQPSRRGKSALGLRWATVLADPVRVGEEMTYDLEMEGPDHNYVANGLVVHNSYNELSARYTPLPNVNYVPSVERLMINAMPTNRQAGTVAGAEELTADHANDFRLGLTALYADAQKLYEWALAAGVPKELARVHLPVGRYSRMRASANLRNWLAFLTLRMAPNAQLEIRQYANGLHEMLAATFPRTMELFDGTK